MRLCINICAYIRIKYVYIYILYIYIFMYVCMHACMYACMYVCVKLHTSAVQWEDTGKRITNCKKNWRTPDIIFRLGWWFWFASFCTCLPPPPPPFSLLMFCSSQIVSRCVLLLFLLYLPTISRHVLSPHFPFLTKNHCYIDDDIVVAAAVVAVVQCQNEFGVLVARHWNLIRKEGRPEEFPFLHVLTTVTRSLYK